MTGSSEPLVTVVTPVYNGEAYLAECIDSVLAQSYPNWEYILVDNCSQDRTLAIAQGYAQRDPRIRIHRNATFVGVIQNHNIACRQMSPASRYCKVLQADDWLFSDCLRQMVHLAESHPTVGIVGSYTLYDTRVRCDGLPYSSTVVSGRDICRLNLLRTAYVFLSPTCLMIRGDLIRNREAYYNEAHLHADVEACYDTLRDCDFGFVHQVLSYVRRHEESLTSSVAQSLNMIPLSNLALLLQYGPTYLTREELARRLKVQRDEYYRTLANGLVNSRERKRMWDHHRRGLAEIRCSWSRAALLKALLRAQVRKWVKG